LFSYDLFRLCGGPIPLQEVLIREHHESPGGSRRCRLWRVTNTAFRLLYRKTRGQSLKLSM